MYFKSLLSYMNWFLLVISYSVIFNYIEYKINNIYSIISHYNRNSHYKLIDLCNETNIITIYDKINKKSVDLFVHSKDMNKINGFDNKWKPIVNIIINSNGGDYFATIKFILKMEEIKKRNVTFNCYSIQASSSAFVIFQYCDKRYVSPSSLLFHHNATIKVPLEELEYFYENYYELAMREHTKINKYISSKIGLTYKEYLEKIRNDWRIKGGKNIMANKLADEIVLFQYKSKINNQTVTVM